MSSDSATGQPELVQGIYNYCALNGFGNTVKALQQESKVPFRTLPPSAVSKTRTEKKDDTKVSLKGKAALQEAVLSGDWGSVVSEFLDGMSLSSQTLFALYEQIVSELCNNFGNAAAAKVILTQSPVMKKMKTQQATRFERIEAAVLDAVENQHRLFASKGSTLDAVQEPDATVLSQRQEVWNFVSAEIVEEPYSTGAASLVSGATTNKRCHEEIGTVDVASWFPPAPQKCKASYSVAQSSSSCCLLNDPSHPQTLCLAAGTINAGAQLIRTGNDGTETTQSHIGCGDSSVSVIAQDGNWLALGYKNGSVKVFNAATCKLLRSFTGEGSGFASAITSLSFFRFNNGICKEDADVESASKVYLPMEGGRCPLLLATAFGCQNAHVLSIRSARVIATYGGSCRKGGDDATVVTTACEIPLADDGMRLEGDDDMKVGGVVVGSAVGRCVLWAISPHSFGTISPDTAEPKVELDSTRAGYGPAKIAGVHALSYRRIAAISEMQAVFVWSLNNDVFAQQSTTVAPVAVHIDGRFQRAATPSCVSSAFLTSPIAQRNDQTSGETIERNRWVAYSVDTSATIRTFDLSATFSKSDDALPQKRKKAHEITHFTPCSIFDLKEHVPSTKLYLEGDGAQHFGGSVAVSRVHDDTVCWALVDEHEEVLHVLE